MTDDSARQMKIICTRLNRRCRRKARRAEEPPTSRDLQIFKAVAVEYCTHQEAAERFEISRGRVSQIVKEVRRKLARSAAEDPHIESYVAQQRLATALEKLRLEHVLETTAKAIRKEPKILSSTRIGSRGGDGKEVSWTESTHRDQRPNMQTVKTFLKATEALSKLNQREIEANPITPLDVQVALFNSLANLLGDWTRSLAKRTDVPSTQFINMVEQFAHNVSTFAYWRRYGISAERAWPYSPPTDCGDDESNNEALTESLTS
jgi:Sigma-70, region 4